MLTRMPPPLPLCSKHLVQECSERVLHGLLAAMLRGSSAAATPEAEGAAAAGGDAAMDDLLFFADKEGDALMFGR